MHPFRDDHNNNDRRMVRSRILRFSSTTTTNMLWMVPPLGNCYACIRISLKQQLWLNNRFHCFEFSSFSVMKSLHYGLFSSSPLASALRFQIQFCSLVLSFMSCDPHPAIDDCIRLCEVDMCRCAVWLGCVHELCECAVWVRYVSALCEWVVWMCCESI